MRFAENHANAKCVPSLAVMYPLDDTIVAIASPPGGAARGILRLSGPEAVRCVARFLRRQWPAAGGRGSSQRDRRLARSAGPSFVAAV